MDRGSPPPERWFLPLLESRQCVSGRSDRGDGLRFLMLMTPSAPRNSHWFFTGRMVAYKLSPLVAFDLQLLLRSSESAALSR